jgi:hypothetical protein
VGICWLVGPYFHGYNCSEVRKLLTERRKRPMIVLL